MEIIRAKTAGFCFGVDRAVKLTYDLLAEGRKVATLGPLIHNAQVVADLEAKGAVTSPDIDAVPDGYEVVIRSHGVPRTVYDKINTRSLAYHDATCPFVAKIHKIAMEADKIGALLLVAGDADHPEVQGIVGHTKGSVRVFANLEELQNLLPALLQQESIYVVAQTTFRVESWENCKVFLKKECTKAKIFDTICFATRERQDEAALISKQSDMMIIIGDRHSSNTAKLKAVCSENCYTYLVERAAELNTINFSHCATVGVTAGASTPSAIIKEVLFAMSEIVNETTNIQVEEVPSEVAAAEDMDFSAALEESLNNMSTDQRVKGVVMGITPTEIQVDIGRKHAGFVPMDEYSADPNADAAKELKVGDTLDLIIMKTNDAEGTVMLSKRRFDAQKAWTDIIAAEEDGRVLEGTVAEVIKGGILVVSGGVRIFIPASLATERKDEPLEDLLKKTVKFRIIEVNKQRRRAVGSIRAVLKDMRKEAAEAFWAQAEVGQKYHGVVKSMTNYGAFVDIGGVDGMVHISEMSWKRIKNPAEVFSICLLYTSPSPRDCS